MIAAGASNGEIAAALGCRVLCWNRSPRPEDPWAELDELCRAANDVVLAALEPFRA